MKLFVAGVAVSAALSCACPLSAQAYYVQISAYYFNDLDNYAIVSAGASNGLSEFSLTAYNGGQFTGNDEYYITSSMSITGQGFTQSVSISPDSISFSFDIKKAHVLSETTINYYDNRPSETTKENYFTEIFGGGIVGVEETGEIYASLGGNFGGPGQVFTSGSFSTVPLPGTAPMLGSALVIIGATGYGWKRRSRLEA